jgi:hypothetical protein
MAASDAEGQADWRQLVTGWRTGRVGAPRPGRGSLLPHIGGMGHLIVMAEGAGDPVRTRENIARLGAEVLPAWRERVSSRPAPGAG